MRVGLTQFCIRPGPQANTERLEMLVLQAVNDGCDFVLTPKASNTIQPDRGLLTQTVNHADDDPVFQMAQRVAAQHEIFFCVWIRCWYRVARTASWSTAKSRSIQAAR